MTARRHDGHMIAVVLHRVLRVAAVVAILVALVGYVAYLFAEVPVWWAAVWSVVAVFLALGALAWVGERVGWKR